MSLELKFKAYCGERYGLYSVGGRSPLNPVGDKHPDRNPVTFAKPGF